MSISLPRISPSNIHKGSKMRLKMLYISLLGAIVLCFVGCAEHSLRVRPDVNPIDEVATPIHCNVIYEQGNSEYLPSMLQHNAESACLAYYSYDVKYVNGNTNWDGLNLFNPLIFVGFPMSEESVLVEAKLSLKEREGSVKEFTASCIANKTRNLFQTGGSTGPRKACLIAVRDTINTQIKHFKKESIHE